MWELGNTVDEDLREAPGSAHAQREFGEAQSIWQRSQVVRGEQEQLTGVEKGDHKKSKREVSGMQGGDSDSDVLNKPAQTNHRKPVSI